MSPFLILGAALALAMDAFAVAIGTSLAASGFTRRQALRLAGHFGIFQLGMPIAGWAAGRTVTRIIEGFDHWIAAGLLTVIAAKMIVEALRKRDAGEPRSAADPTRGASLVILSVATSLDSLAVGLGLGALAVPIVVPAAVIGGVAFAMTLLGTRIGPALGRWAGKGAEIAGGAVLLAIAAKILVDHLA